MKFAEIVVLSQDVYSRMVIDCDNKEKIEVIAEHPKTNNIATAIASYFDDIDIQVYSTQPRDDETNGLYTRYNLPNGSILIDIDVNSKLNTCWSRLLTKRQALIINPPKLDFNDDIPSEYLALFFALELLVPYCHNDFVMDMSISSYKIAETFMVPEIMIDMLREDWYQKLRNKSYN